MAKKNHRKQVVKKAKRKVIKVKAKVTVPANKNRVNPVISMPLPKEQEVPVGPEPFDVEEWMEEQGLKRGGWEVYHKAYDKEFCEIKRKDGSELSPCWPNAGKFIWLGDESIEVPEEDVTHIRYFKPKYKMMHEEDEWDVDSVEEDEPEDTDDSGL